MCDNVRVSAAARSAVLVTGAPQWAQVGHAAAGPVDMAWLVMPAGWAAAMAASSAIGHGFGDTEQVIGAP